MKPVRVLGLVFALLACARSSPAQQSVDLASIGGRVVDPSGAVVRGAEVTARHVDTNVTAKTATDAEGRFRFPYLKIGPYIVTVRQPGFRDAAQSLTLSAGAAFELPISLAVGGVDADVTVTAETTVLEAARSQIAGTIPEHEVRNLPMNGRNFLDAALLVPGVSPTNVPATQMFPETSAVPGVGLSVSSQRNLSNNFVVDGLSANDDAAALSGITYGVDAIEQFQVVTSGGQAELGRALGGYVNIVTKSGTNAVHGSVYDYVRDDGPERAESPDRQDAADVAVAVRRLGRRPAAEESHVLFQQRRAAPSRSVRAGDDSGRRPSRSSTRGWRRSAIQGPQRRDRRLPDPRALDQRARQGRSPGQRPRSVQRALQPLPPRLAATRATPGP